MNPCIAIVGGGTAGWMAAAALAIAFKGRAQITLIEAPSDMAPAGAEATLPSMRAFHETLGIAEDDLVRSIGATFRLGTLFRGWSDSGRDFFHAFGNHGTPVDTVAFHHCWLRLRDRDVGALPEYTLGAVAASLGRFARPSHDTNSVLSSFDYGLHLDTARYTDFMRERALAHGVIRHGARFAAAYMGDHGIAALQLDDGTQHQADLYLDCTDDGALIGGALKIGWEDWSRWFTCTRALCISTSRTNPLPPHSTATAHAFGWKFRVPLDDRTEHILMYGEGADAEAAAFLAGLPGRALGPPVRRAVANGRRTVFWAANCVALGGGLDPLAPRLHMIQSAITRLIALFPNGGDDAPTRDEYNRLTIAEWERIRDFSILHYAASGRREPLWVQAREAEPPEMLCYKIALYRSRARVVPYEGEIFHQSDWLSVFEGLGIRPVRYHPFADAFDERELTRRLQTLRIVVRQAAEAMPPHDDTLAQFAGAR